jgi:hypothetical protein
MAHKPLSLEKRELRHTMNGFSEKDNAHYFMHNVPDDLQPLAFGTNACSAGDAPKVPEAWQLCLSFGSVFIL